MTTTSVSLIDRLHTTSDEAVWSRFVELYSPLLYRWVERVGLQKDEAADLVQEIFLVLMKELPLFECDPSKSFRAWLKTVAQNRSRRPQPGLSDASQQAACDEETPFFTRDEYNRAVTQRALELMQTEFELTTWKACWECVVVGRAAGEVGQELGMTVNAVYLAKSWVLRRLRQEIDRLVD